MSALPAGHRLWLSHGEKDSTARCDKARGGSQVLQAAEREERDGERSTQLVAAGGPAGGRGERGHPPGMSAALQRG